MTRRATSFEPVTNRNVRRTITVPKLLVSVRNVSEAQAAVGGGCDLLDVKEPARGPLGMADRRVIAEVAQFAAGAQTDRPLECSVALGEVDELPTGGSPFVLP